MNFYQMLRDWFWSKMEEPPASDWSPEMTARWDRAGRAIKANLLPIVQSVLITVAGYVLLGVVQQTLVPWLSQVWAHPSRGKYGPWMLAGLLLVLAGLLPLLKGLWRRYWLSVVRRRWALVLLPLSLALLYAAIKPQWVLGVVMLFISILLLLWRQPATEQDSLPEDRLQRERVADALLALLTAESTDLHRIALKGGWGEGKTDVLLRLRRKLRGDRYAAKFGVAMINPWMTESVEALQAMIVGAMEEALGLPGHFRARPASFLGRLLSAVKLSFGGSSVSMDLQKLFTAGATSEQDQLIQRINETMEQTNRTCVILVDDMERAYGEIIRRVFPMLDVFRRVKKVRVIFAIDPDRVAAAFGETSQSDPQTRGYLDKVFDFQIDLPRLRHQDLDRVVHHLRPFGPKLEAVWPELAKNLPPTPRETLRFVKKAIEVERLFLGRYGRSQRIQFCRILQGTHV